MLFLDTALTGVLTAVGLFVTGDFLETVLCGVRALTGVLAGFESVFVEVFEWGFGDVGFCVEVESLFNCGFEAGLAVLGTGRLAADIVVAVPIMIL